MSLMSSACFHLGPSTAPGMAHCPPATARAPGKGNGRKRLSWAHSLCGHLLEAPFSYAPCIYSLIHLFDKNHSTFIHSSVICSFSKSLCLEETPSQWHQSLYTKSFIHSFIQLHLSVSLSPNPNTEGELSSVRTAEKTLEQLVEAHSPRCSPCSFQNQQCPSLTLGIGGMSPLPPPPSPRLAS